MHACLKTIADAYLDYLGLPVWTVKGMVQWATFMYQAEDKR